MEEINGKIFDHVYAPCELGAASNQRFVLAPGHEVDHHEGGPLLDDVEALVNAPVGTMLGESVFNDLNGG